MSINKHGLKRTIDASIKREIRQRCGFGCVNCGNAVYQYEHVDPPFSDAKIHDPSCIVLLCGGCHDRVTRGILSKETIKLKSSNPKCVEQGFSFGPFDLGLIEPEILVGTLKSKGVKTLIRVLGDDVLSIKRPESEGLPFLISANLSDRDGNAILRIEDNEWITTTENWDVEIIGTNITIRKQLGDIVLSLRSEPPGKLVIERLEMLHRGVIISAKENDSIEVVTRSGQHLKSKKTEIEGCQIGIDINENGLSIGVGGGSVYFESLQLNSASQSIPRIPSRRSTLPFRVKPFVIAINRALYGRFR